MMVCVLAHVGLGNIFRLVGHHSATPPSLTRPSAGRVQQVQHLQDGRPGTLDSKILNGSVSSRGKSILAVRQSFAAVEAHLLFINFSSL